MKSAELVKKGAYILKDSPTAAEVVIIATGSEVSVALAVQSALADKSVAVRVFKYLSETEKSACHL